MNKMIIVRGLPGSGKTTLGNTMAEALGGIVHSADDYFYENGPNAGEYDFDMDSIGAAHLQCKDRVKAAMVSGISAVIVANTTTTEREITPYIEMAEKFGYEVTSIVVENRHGNSSVHGVPTEVMKKMEDRFSLKLR